MKKINYNGEEYLNFSYEQHIKKHTKRENTYNKECLFCVFGDWKAKSILKEIENSSEDI